MKMFYTEHYFQVDRENFEFNLKFHAERIQHYLLIFMLQLESCSTF